VALSENASRTRYTIKIELKLTFEGISFLKEFSVTGIGFLLTSLRRPSLTRSRIQWSISFKLWTSEKLRLTILSSTSNDWHGWKPQHSRNEINPHAMKLILRQTRGFDGVLYNLPSSNKMSLKCNRG